ncbi:MAG: penicillin-binding protein 2 [Mycobacteriales bacterium]
MNAPLRKVAVAALALFGLLFLNVNYVQFVRADELRENQYNRRVVFERYGRARGEIIAGDKAVVTNRKTDGEYKFQRVYVDGPLYASITGYYSLYRGRAGIESKFDQILSGEDDSLFVARVSDLVTGREPQGANVKLTIRPDLQELAAKLLAGRRGSVVAMDPKTGAILAMVNLPSYDPEPIASVVKKESDAGYQAALDAPGKPLVSKASAETYPPGSVFKVITAAAYFEQLRKTPTDLVPSPKELPLPLTKDVVLRNFGNATCGADQITVERALEISCNTAFANMGLDIGGDGLRATAEAFGFNEPVESLPFQTNRSRFPSGINAPQLAQSAIGQFDVRATPLQMASVAATIANGGIVMRPYVVDSIITSDLRTVRKTEPERLRKQPAVSPQTAVYLNQMMRTVVRTGSGVRAQVPGVEVAGKTGTAQNVQDQPPHAWFIGFAPADDPQIAIAVFIEGGDGGSAEATGGRVAAPVAQAIIAAALKGPAR